MAVSLLKNMQVSSPKKVKKTVGWFIPGTPFGLDSPGLELLLGLVSSCQCLMMQNAPDYKQITKDETC